MTKNFALITWKYIAGMTVLTLCMAFAPGAFAQTSTGTSSGSTATTTSSATGGGSGFVGSGSGSGSSSGSFGNTTGSITNNMTGTNLWSGLPSGTAKTSFKDGSSSLTGAHGSYFNKGGGSAKNCFSGQGC